MIDPRATSAQFDMMRASIALDVLRLEFPPQDQDDDIARLLTLRERAIAILTGVLDANT